MKLEFKLTLSTGALILASLLSAYSAHIRIQEASRLSVSVTNKRIPIYSETRELRVQILSTVHALEAYMLFGVDPASAAAQRQSRQEHFARAEASMAQLEQYSKTFDLDSDTPRLQQLRSDLSLLKPLEERVEQLNESRTSEGTSQAYDLLQKRILPLEDSMFATVSALSESQMSQTNHELDQLRQANHATLVTLWLRTILGAIVGGIISFLLGRRITTAVRLVSARANAIAQGDLTGAELNLNSDDQIGDLAVAMQKMQSSLASIIGAVSDTAGTLTTNAASMRTASDQVHRRIDQQSQQTQQAATAMQEMSASIAEVSRHTQSAAETARQRRRNRPRRRQHRQAGTRQHALHRHRRQ